MDIKLHCAGGEAAPEPVVEGWREYLALPGKAQVEVWKIVVDSLAQPDTKLTEERIQVLGAVHEVEVEKIIEAALAAQYLLANACTLGLETGSFREDLLALSDGKSGGVDVILSRYETIRTELQSLELFKTLSAHGKVLKNVEWRMDKVVSSSRGYHQEADVVFLTLIYEEGAEESRITLQMGKQGIASLQRFMTRFES